MRVLVTGGAGYIGSHIVHELRRNGVHTVILDDLSLGHAESVEGFDLVRGDIGNRDLVRETIISQRIDVLIHMAARSQVGESVRDPGVYYDHNVRRSLELLEGMREAGCKRMVFSSSAAVYGEPKTVPILEEHPALPTNPYGATKLCFEEALGWYRQAYGFGFISLRYFNAAGAVPEDRLGEDHDPETHLIPLVLQTALGRRERLVIHGTDYPTPDGSCIRDYIHVVDLARAHVQAAKRLSAGSPGAIYNLGTGTGTSVKEVIAVARTVTGREIPTQEGPRRAGDPAVLVAASSRTQAGFDWTPRIPLRKIIESAWDWHSRNPDGYGGL
ncbi:MAG: UDP-glucose 4-epimerase GalE [Acidobacteria bacterium]|nr:UDP-glucose 4-epimerase GalE [Acidobacteriota bacterium]